jgi:SAM-dependent methyltransferase
MKSNKTSSWLSKLLVNPAIGGLAIENLYESSIWGELIRSKPFLKSIYTEWYIWLANVLPDRSGKILELGSNGGFLHEFIPGLIRSDLKCHPGTHLQANGMQLPFNVAALNAIVMTNVLHHIEDPSRFFTEAALAIKPGGVLAMVEPWANPWATLIYRNFHHEPFEPKRHDWCSPPFGHGHANGATPWIIFKRDRAIFEKRFPEWQISYIRPSMPITYLLSGGVSMRNLVPSASYGLLRRLERLCEKQTGMFAFILLVRR